MLGIVNDTERGTEMLGWILLKKEDALCVKIDLQTHTMLRDSSMHSKICHDSWNDCLCLIHKLHALCLCKHMKIEWSYSTFLAELLVKFNFTNFWYLIWLLIILEQQCSLRPSALVPRFARCLSMDTHSDTMQSFIVRLQTTLAKWCPSQTFEKAWKVLIS